MSPDESLLGHLKTNVSQEYQFYEQLTHQNKSMHFFFFFLILSNPWLHVETFYFSCNFSVGFFPSINHLPFANVIVKDFLGDIQYRTFWCSTHQLASAYSIWCYKRYETWHDQWDLIKCVTIQDIALKPEMTFSALFCNILLFVRCQWNIFFV